MWGEMRIALKLKERKHLFIEVYFQVILKGIGISKSRRLVYVTFVILDPYTFLCVGGGWIKMLLPCLFSSNKGHIWFLLVVLVVVLKELNPTYCV